MCVCPGGTHRACDLHPAMASATCLFVRLLPFVKSKRTPFHLLMPSSSLPPSLLSFILRHLKFQAESYSGVGSSAAPTCEWGDVEGLGWPSVLRLIVVLLFGNSGSCIWCLSVPDGKSNFTSDGKPFRTTRTKSGVTRTYILLIAILSATRCNN